MKQFLTIDELIEAKAQAQHYSNLNYGGVFDASGNRFSDIEVERRVAKRRGTTHVYRDRAKDVIGVELSGGTKFAQYIKNFGYVELR